MPDIYDKLRAYMAKLPKDEETPKLQRLPIPDEKARVSDEAGAAEYGRRWMERNRKAMDRDVAQGLEARSQADIARGRLAEEAQRSTAAQARAGYAQSKFDQEDAARAQQEAENVVHKIGKLGKGRI